MWKTAQALLCVFVPPLPPRPPFNLPPRNPDGPGWGAGSMKRRALSLPGLCHKVMQADQMQKGFRPLLISADDLKLNVPAAEDDLALSLMTSSSQLAYKVGALVVHPSIMPPPP